MPLCLITAPPTPRTLDRPQPASAPRTSRSPRACIACPRCRAPTAGRAAASPSPPRSAAASTAASQSRRHRIIIIRIPIRSRTRRPPRRRRRTRRTRCWERCRPEVYSLSHPRRQRAVGGSRRPGFEFAVVPCFVEFRSFGSLSFGFVLLCFVRAPPIHSSNFSCSIPFRSCVVDCVCSVLSRLPCGSLSHTLSHTIIVFRISCTLARAPFNRTADARSRLPQHLGGRHGGGAAGEGAPAVLSVRAPEGLLGHRLTA